MKIIPIASDSLGVRSMATYVETNDCNLCSDYLNCESCTKCNFCADSVDLINSDNDESDLMYYRDDYEEE